MSVSNVKQLNEEKVM